MRRIDTAPHGQKTMGDTDVKLTTVSKGGAKLGTVIPSEAMSKSDGKVRGKHP